MPLSVSWWVAALSVPRGVTVAHLLEASSTGLDKKAKHAKQAAETAMMLARRDSENAKKKGDRLASMSDTTIDYTSEDFVEAVNEATDGRGVESCST